MCEISYCSSVSEISDFWWEAFLRPLVVLKAGPLFWQPWSSLGFSPGEQHPGGGWQPGEGILSASCHGGSDASTNLQFLPHLSLMCFWSCWVESSPRQSLLQHWGLQDQHWRQCSVFAGEGTSSSRSSPHWSCVLGHPMFSLAFPPTGQGFPSMLFPSTPLSPAVMLAASFALLSSAFHTDLFFTRGALLRGSLLCQSWALPSEPSRKELSLLKVCREGSSCSGASGLTFLLLRRAILSTLHLCSPPASVCKSKKFF